jgi:hypothetical protein
MLLGTVIDLSFDPIADASAVAGLLLMWWQGRKGSKKSLRRPKSSDRPSQVLGQKKAPAVQKVDRTYPNFGQAEGAPVGAPLYR